LPTPPCCDTLSPRQFRAGYAEVAKYGALGDEAFFAWLEANHADIFSGGAAREHAIATSCRAKAAIVSRDERETGERALLNLGPLSAMRWKLRPAFPIACSTAKAFPSAWCWRRNSPPNSA